MGAKKVRLGVVGLGAAGSRHAETAANRLAHVELAAIVDANDVVAEDFSRRLDARRLDYGELLADGTVDGVVLATPTPTHPPMIEEAARAGKHIFCEKPLGLDMSASVHAVQVAQQQGVFLQVAFVRRFDHDWADAQARIKEGEIGEVYFFRASHRDKIVYTDLSYIGQVGNFFQDVMVHDFDVARWMIGEVEEVSAWGANPTFPQMREIGEAQVACVQLRFASGAIGSIDGSMLANHGHDCHTEVLGQEGAIRVGYGARTTDVVSIVNERASHRVHRDFRKRFEAGFIGELEHFADSIINETQPKVDGQDGLAAYAIAEAASESLRAGRPVKVADIEAAAAGART